MSKFYDIGTSDILGSRKNQEDSYIVTDPAGSDESFDALDHILVVVADGVGGEAAGEVASKTVTNFFSRTVQSAYSGSKDIPQLLSNALHGANQAIAKAIADNIQYEGMASTIIGALIIRDQLYWVSVGDSHLYLLRDGSCIKLNADHSIGGIIDRNADEGIISKTQAANAPNRNMLYSCVMGEELAAIDLPDKPFTLQKGDRLLLSSDGLDTLSTKQIARISNNKKNAQQFADALTGSVEQANKPNQDNTMVVVVDMVSGPVVKNEENTAPVTKKRKKFPLIALILLIILGVFALYYFLSGTKDEKPGDMTEPPAPNAGTVRKPASGKAGKEDKLKLKSIPGN